MKYKVRQKTIRRWLSSYFARKAIEAADKLWEDGVIDEHTIEAWKEEHMRTPYLLD